MKINVEELMSPLEETFDGVYLNDQSSILYLL